MKTGAVILIALAIAGCGHRKETHEAGLTHAYRLIDAHKDDEAIAYLEKLCPAENGAPDCRVAMASAYAHKAGIKVQRFVGVVTASKNTGKLEITFNNSTRGDENSRRVDGSMNNLSAFLIKLAGIINIYTSIPTVKNTDTVYLEEAIRIMDGLEEPRQVDALYRGVLRIIYFKHVFAEEVVGAGSKGNLGPACKLDLGLMGNTIGKLGRILIAILDDLELANPSRAKSYEKMKLQVANDTLALTTHVSSVTVVDEAANLYFKRLVIEQGFGKLLKCKGAQSPL